MGVGVYCNSGFCVGVDSARACQWRWGQAEVVTTGHWRSSSSTGSSTFDMAAYFISRSNFASLFSASSLSLMITQKKRDEKGKIVAVVVCLFAVC